MTSTDSIRPNKTSLAHQTQQLRRNLETPIPAPRIALERKISLRFPHFQGFLTEYCSNVSITGMFIQSQEPRSPGEILDFEFNLIDGLQLIRGTGEVMWARLTDEDPQMPAGMGIRFLRLDAESRRLIRWAVEKQISAGGKPFDLEVYRSEALEITDSAVHEHPSRPDGVQPGTARHDAARPDAAELDAAPHDAARPGAARPDAPATARPRPTGMAIVDAQRRHPYAGYAMARQSDLRAGLLAAATVALPVAVLAAAVLISHPWSGSQAFATGSIDVEARAAEATPAMPVTPAEPAAAADGELVESTLAWAQAWAGQRPEDYLRHYSRRFQPPRSMSRGAWEAQRTERISQPDFIKVDVSSLTAELIDPEHGRVTFDQVYRSDNFRDSMRKTLELVREDGGWKILEERAAG